MFILSTEDAAGFSLAPSETMNETSEHLIRYYTNNDSAIIQVINVL